MPDPVNIFEYEKLAEASLERGEYDFIYGLSADNFTQIRDSPYDFDTIDILRIRYCAVRNHSQWPIFKLRIIDHRFEKTHCRTVSADDNNILKPSSSIPKLSKHTGKHEPHSGHKNNTNYPR